MCRKYWTGERVVDAATCFLLLSIFVWISMMEVTEMSGVVYPVLPAHADEWTVEEIRAALKDAASKGKAITLAPQLAEEWFRALERHVAQRSVAHPTRHYCAKNHYCDECRYRAIFEGEPCDKCTNDNCLWEPREE